MNIELNGYFDKNFGDDIMHTIVVEHFPHHNFYVYGRECEMFAHLEAYPNVFINTEVSHIDVFLNVTGTGFMYKGKRAKFEKLINMIMSKPKKYPKSAVINCSIEPFEGRVDEYFAKRDLAMYDLVTCRDNSSYEYLKKVKNNVKVHSDLVFSKSVVHKDDKENILGIAPVRRLYDGTNYRYYKELAQYADYYIQKNGGKVLLFAFDSALENDISATLSIKKMMKHAEYADIVIYNSDIKAFEEKLGRCSLLVGSRFHSIVEAYAHNINAVGIYDRKKLELLCNDLNIPSVSKDNFTSEILVQITENASFPDTDEQIISDANGHIKCLEQFLDGQG